MIRSDLFRRAVQFRMTEELWKGEKEMQVNRFYTPYTPENVKVISGFSRNESGKLEVQIAEKQECSFAELIDPQEVERAWEAQLASTPFSYRINKGYNAEENSISLVPGMRARLSNGYQLVIESGMVRSYGNIHDVAAGFESNDWASALGDLIKVANGQIPISFFYFDKNYSGYAEKALQAFGVDTSRPFTINESKFYINGRGQIRHWGD